MINVTRSSMPSFEEFCEEIRPLWESHWLTNHGEKHEALAERLRGLLDVPQVELFTNGHLALEALLAALKLAPGEIITTPFTFASTTHAIVRKGFQPVFADVKADGTLDPAGIEPLITERTRAILPVHVYGRLCDTDAIEAIADRYGLPVIYDAAHAFGVSKNGVSAARFGLASMFSFHATKVYHTIEGGAVATGDAELAGRLRLERNYGITGPEAVVSVGGNAKMSEFQAAMGLCNLRHMDEWIAGRRAVFERYLAELDGVKGLGLPGVQPGVSSNYAYFPVLFPSRERRDAACAALLEAGVYARKYFYPLVTDFACYRGRPGFDTERLPMAKRLSDGVATLPLYPELSMADVSRICRVIAHA